MSDLPELDSVLDEESQFGHSDSAMLQDMVVEIESRCYDPDASQFLYWVYKTHDGGKTWREFVPEDELSPV